MSGRVFEVPGRAGADRCAVLARDAVNDHVRDWTLASFRGEGCLGLDRARQLADNNGRVLWGGHSTCALADDPHLAAPTHYRDRNQLCQRVFVANPGKVGTGSSMFVGAEDSIVQGLTESRRRSCRDEPRVDRFEPQTPCRAASGVAAPPAWWGGEPTRDEDRRRAFLESTGYQLTGGVWHRQPCVDPPAGDMLSPETPLR
jgi:hypothetical protein